MRRSSRRKRRSAAVRPVQLVLLSLVLLLVLAFKIGSGAFAESQPPATQPVTEKLSATLLEIPSGADTTVSQLVSHMGYTACYNHTTLNPDWVAYELTGAETIGDLPRASKFMPDPDLQGLQAQDRDFRNSGWDRGHMAPAADMKWSSQAMRESFYFTNICPQNHNLNAGDWKSLEELCRRAAERYKRIWIVSGPLFRGNRYGTIGESAVRVPDAFFKVLLIMTDSGYAGVGFLCENQAGHHPLRESVTTIDNVESLTGLDFFPSLPESTQIAVESQFDCALWGI